MKGREKQREKSEKESKREEEGSTGEGRRERDVEGVRERRGRLKVTGRRGADEDRKQWREKGQKE